MTNIVIKCSNCGQDNNCDLSKGNGIFKCGSCKKNIQSTHELSSLIKSDQSHDRGIYHLQKNIDTNATRQTLDKIRPKLLDMSRKNRLLNFRETTQSIAIVEEQPSQVFSCLVNNRKEMVFLPIPEFSLEEIKKENLKTSEKNKPSEDVDQKNSDNKLQTKIDSEKLEIKLRRLASSARTIIEETGTNQLYLALGFLEWRESVSSEEISSAPLILVPIELNKCERIDFKTKTFRYEIRYTDEDLLTNITLAEKLRQEFSVSLPEFDETKDAEDYFQEVELAISQHKNWSVKRLMHIGFFTFSKLLMYLDLDPNNWPENKNILEHAQINLVSNGNSLSNHDLLSETEVETDQLAQSLHLVLDADSSQHAAIADVIKGKSLVIEGPPGTGKSQTITNIIATALHRPWPLKLEKLKLPNKLPKTVVEEEVYEKVTIHRRTDHINFGSISSWC